MGIGRLIENAIWTAALVSLETNHVMPWGLRRFRCGLIENAHLDNSDSHAKNVSLAHHDNRGTIPNQAMLFGPRLLSPSSMNEQIALGNCESLSQAEFEFMRVANPRKSKGG